ncbi:MAG: C25 family cysteine peptidase [Candidatus Diapherotrites archaeon]
MNRFALALLAFALAFSSYAFAEQVVSFKGEVQALNTHDLFYSVGLTENTPNKIDACALTPTYMLYFENSTDTVFGWNIRQKRWEQGLISELYPQIDGPIDAFTYIPSSNIYEITSGNKAWVLKDGKISDTPYNISEIAAEQCAGLEKCPSSGDAVTFYKDSAGNNQFIWLVNGNRELDIWFSKGGALHYNHASIDNVGFFKGRMDSVDALCTFPDGGYLIFGEGEYTGSGGWEIGPNEKLMSKYSDKEVFLVSDADWHDVLQLVPVSIWTEGGEVHKNPALIYHQEPCRSTDLDLTYIGHWTGSDWQKGFKDPIGAKVTVEPADANWYETGTFSKFANLKPGDEVTLSIKITTGAVVKSIEITEKPDFIQFTNPADGKIENINRAAPEGETFEFGLKISEDKEVQCYESFDAESAMYFMRQYPPQRLTIAGETPQDLDNLLMLDSEYGARLTEGQVQRISPADYFAYWKAFDTVVLTDYDNYEAALLASAYASYINAPLIFVNGGNLDEYKNVIGGRHVIIVGQADSATQSYINSNSAGAEQYSLEQMQKKYAELTNTNKLILVNPDDLDIKEVLDDYDGYGIYSHIHVYEIYGRNSLAAPFLASAKHELILSTRSANYMDVDAFIDSSIEALGADVEYLTIVASPNAIGMDYLDEGGDYYAADAWFYSKTKDGDPLLDLAVGRIFGVTVADTSAYVVRSMFYDETLQNEESMLITMGRTDQTAPAEVYAFGKVMSSAGYATVVIPEGEGPNMLNPHMKPEHWKDKFFTIYRDHGGTTWAGIDAHEIPYLDNSFITTMACLTCTFKYYFKYSFCANAIRQGAIGFIGATDSSGGVNMDGQIAEIFANGSTTGEAFRNSKNAGIVLDAATLTQGNIEDNSSGWYLLIGDPTMKVRTAHTLPKARMEFISEASGGGNYGITVPAMRIDIPENIAELCEYYPNQCKEPLYFTTASAAGGNKNFTARLEAPQDFEPVAVSKGWQIDHEYGQGRKYLWVSKLDEYGKEYFTTANDSGFTDYDFDIELYSEAPDLAIKNPGISGDSVTFDITNIGNKDAVVTLEYVTVMVSAKTGGEENVGISLAPGQAKHFSVDILGGNLAGKDKYMVNIGFTLQEGVDFIQQNYTNDMFRGEIAR